jgi:hypothetical protein
MTKTTISRRSNRPRERVEQQFSGIIFLLLQLKFNPIFGDLNYLPPSQPATITKKAPAKKTPASGSKQGTLSFAPSGRRTKGGTKD